MAEAESLETHVTLLSQSFGTTVGNPASLRVPMQSPLCRKDDFISFACERFAEQAFAFAGSAVTKRGVKEVDAAVSRGSNRLQAILAIHIQTGHARDRPAPKCDWGYKQIGGAKWSAFHGLSWNRIEDVRSKIGLPARQRGCHAATRWHHFGGVVDAGRVGADGTDGFGLEMERPGFGKVDGPVGVGLSNGLFVKAGVGRRGAAISGLVNGDGRRGL